jgi:hypothetical protein
MIAIQNADDSFSAIYVHSDGYPAGVGRKLVDHYTDPTKISALFALGDLSVLGASIGEKVDFDSLDSRLLARQRGQCIAYRRDRGEVLPDRVYQSPADLRQACIDMDAEWLYLWARAWWCVPAGDRLELANHDPHHFRNVECVAVWIRRSERD